MGFQNGDKIEVCSDAEGFHGSYFSATFLQHIRSYKNTSFLVQYDTLLKDDESGPLLEVVKPSEVRPRPPRASLPINDDRGLKLGDAVDAYDRDGWWVGKISGRDEEFYGNYKVYFDYWNVEISYPRYCLRFHQDWINGHWISSKNIRL